MPPAGSSESVTRRAARPGAGGVVSRPGLWERLDGSAPEIAGEVSVSTTTVKTHLRNLYAKLGVHRRTEAVERARVLGLLAPSGSRRRLSDLPRTGR